MATWIMIDTLSYVNLDTIPSVTFAVSADGHLRATIQPRLGEQREAVVLGHEAAQNLKEYLCRAAAPHDSGCPPGHWRHQCHKRHPRRQTGRLGDASGWSGDAAGDAIWLPGDAPAGASIPC